MTQLLENLLPEQITTQFLVSQILSLIAVVTIVIGYFAKKRSCFLITQIVANLLISATYFLLGTMVGCIGIAIATIRTAIFFIYEKKNKVVPYWLVGVFVVCVCINSIIFWENILDLFCLIAINLFTIAFRIKKDTVMKSVLLVANLLFLLFNLFNHDIIGAINKTVEIITLIISIIRHLTPQKQQLHRQNPKPQVQTPIA